MNKDINARLKEIRIALRMNQLDFAKKLGIKQGSLSDIERNKVNVSNRIIEAMQTNIGVNREWLYTGTGSVFIDGFYENIDGINTRFDTQNTKNQYKTEKDQLLKEDTDQNKGETSFESQSKVKIQYILKADEILKRDYNKLYKLRKYIEVIQTFPDATFEINSLIDNVLKSVWSTKEGVFDFNEYLGNVVNSLEELEAFFAAFKKLALAINEFYEDLEELDDMGKDYFDIYKLHDS